LLSTQGYNNLLAVHQVVHRLVPVIAHAIVVFGDERKAAHWFETPLPLFDNRTPSELLETIEGTAIVEQTLTRIEHNIPS
jgi:putative toxin-antitoxin system antitoxin component (TIGR02293 family)